MSSVDGYTFHELERRAGQAGEMLVKCLLYTHEIDPRTHVEKLGVVAYPCPLSTGEMEMGKSLGFTDQPCILHKVQTSQKKIYKALKAGCVEDARRGGRGS